MRITAPLRVVVSLARRPKAARSCAPQGFVNGDGFIAVRRSPVNRARSPTRLTSHRAIIRCLGLPAEPAKSFLIER